MIHTIKSIPVEELVVTSLIHVSMTHGDATGQDNDGQPTVEAEVEIINPELHEAATFGPFNSRCDCCGSTRLKHACTVVHKPTLVGYYVGRDCATKLMNMADGAFSKMSVALAERGEQKRRVASWITRNPQHAEIVAWADSSTHYIVSDLVSRLRRYGNLSEKQVELLYKIKNQIADKATAKANEPTPTTPAPSGRVKVSGTVLGTKSIEGRFGFTHKALIRLTDFNKVWVTCHKVVGESVTFTATFTASATDSHFATGSRPIWHD
jgi:hypothetical protein